MNGYLKTTCIQFLFLLLLFSCKNDPYATYPQWILGEWISTSMYGYVQENGFNFVSKDSCEIRPGYRYLGEIPVLRRYYGNMTTYRIQNDTLFLFDLKENQWKICTICFQSPDTFIISYPYTPYGDAVTYIRPKQALPDEPLFDQIIIKDRFYQNKTLSINQAGDMFYRGDFDTFLEGLYVSKEGQHVFKQIERQFREANAIKPFIHTFPQRLDSIESWAVPTITFVKNHQMATVAGPVWGDDVFEEYYIRDYHSSEFLCAYEQSLYLEQQMPVETWDSSKYVLNLFCDNRLFCGFGFENKHHQMLGLYLSEDVYLLTQLLQAALVDADFTPLYKVYFQKNKYLLTDGRYYRYRSPQGKVTTVDIGFNFIEENGLAAYFK